MKAKTRIERITPQMLERELRSPVFVAGLEESIKATARTGYESLFEVDKKVFGRKLFYPPTIELGDETSVSGGIFDSVGELRAKQRYQEKTGKDPSAEENWHDFVSFSCREEPTFELFPEHLARHTYGDTGNDLDKFYTLIRVHTHPNGVINPSLQDVTNVNKLRRRNLRNFGLPLKLISVIAGVHKENIPEYGLLLFQEKSEQPIPTEHLDDAHKSLGDLFDKEQMMIRLALFGSQMYNPYFNIAPAVLNTEKHALEFNPRYLAKFGFSYSSDWNAANAEAGK